MLDIDCLIVGDLRPLFAYDADFVGWRPNSLWGKCNRIGGGTWLLRTGTCTQVWDRFSAEGVQKARLAGWRGSDQAWISYCLSSTCAVWPREIGIYQKQDGANRWLEPPSDARIVHFNGDPKPWDLKIPWVRKAFGKSG